MRIVVVNYASSKAGAESVVAAITKAGGKAVAVGGDITKAAEAQGVIDAAIKAYGRLDILVNNAGWVEPIAIEPAQPQSTCAHSSGAKTRVRKAGAPTSPDRNP